MVITGVIRPPPDIRVVADRTASYVAKNGRAFEARILNSEKGRTPKFAFLQPSSPFNAYYEDQIKFYENGGDAESEAVDKDKSTGNAMSPQKEPVRKKEKQQKASAIDPISKALLVQRSKIAKSGPRQQTDSASRSKDAHPDSSDFTSLPSPKSLELITIVPPSSLDQYQLETIQLVAQFSALDGKGGVFLHYLAVREWKNTDFAFCQPRHPHFPYFTSLVDAYRKILSSWASVQSLQERRSTDQILEEAAYRAEYEKHMESQMSKKSDDEMIAIDWHDFVVVETIDFPLDEAVELSMLPPPPPTPVDLNNKSSGMSHTYADENDEEENIRVVPSYMPKVVGPAKPKESRAIDPITGKSISVRDMPEHLRIQLLDPKWAEERKRFQDKQKESNLVGDEAVASNLRRFAKVAHGGGGGREANGLPPPIASTIKTNQTADNLRSDLLTVVPTTSNSSIASAQPLGEPDAKRRRVHEDDFGSMSSSNADVMKGQQTSESHRATEVFDTSFPIKSADEFESEQKSSVLSESEFMATLSKPEVTLQIRIPNDPSQMAWNFYGQILSMTVHAMTTVKDVKAKLSRTNLNEMPVNKMQLKDMKIGFLKDSLTLASLNIGPAATLEMIPKTRGGRK